MEAAIGYFVSAKVWIDGAVVDAEAARISVFDRGFLYGDSIYEVLRTFDGRPFGVSEHLDRLERSAAGLEMSLPLRADIVRAIDATLAAANEKNAYVRIIVTRGAGEIGLSPTLADGPRLLVMVRAAHLPPVEAYRDGIAVCMVQRSRGSATTPGASVDPSLKSGNYLPSVLAAAEAGRRHAYEAILCDAVGRITEGGSSNLFIVRGGRLGTPQLSLGLLAGITRSTVIGLATKAGIAVDELPLWPDDLRTADEAFITSSVRGILPAVRVDGDAIGSGKPGPVTLRVMALYQQLTESAT